MTTNIAGGGHDVGGSVGEGWGHVEIHGSSAPDGSVERDGMSYEEAVEHFEFKVAGGWVGDNTPVFLTLLDEYR